MWTRTPGHMIAKSYIEASNNSELFRLMIPMPRTISTKNSRTHDNGVIGLSCVLRLTLINAGYFGGTPDQASISELLRVAYEDFTSWRKSKKDCVLAADVQSIAGGSFGPRGLSGCEGMEFQNTSPMAS